MKFYKDKNFYYWLKIINKLTAIHCDRSVRFLKNGKYHNSKNFAYIRHDGLKEFYLNKFYGDQNDFTKKSWRKFVKLQAFL